PRGPQDSARATYAPLLRKEDGAVNWAQPGEAVRNRIHGCNPTPGAFTQREGETLKLWLAEALPGAGEAAEAPGTGVEGTGTELVILTGDGVVRRLEVQPESRARMSGGEYRRGYRVRPGERWG